MHASSQGCLTAVCCGVKIALSEMIDEMCYVIKLQQVEASDMQVADNRQNGQVN